MKNKKGIVSVSRTIIDMLEVKVLKAIFSNFYPVKIIESENYCNDSVVSYFGYSEHFRELKEGDKIPDYQLIMTEKEGCEFIEVKVEEIEFGESPILACVTAFDLIKLAEKSTSELIDRLKTSSDARIPEGKIIIGYPLNFDSLKTYQIKP